MCAKTFKGGIHPYDYKHFSNHKVIEKFPAPEKLYIPLIQHIGRPAVPIVKVGDEVKKGQKIADADGFVSIPMHSPVSGKVTKIRPYPHPTGTIQHAIEIENDGNYEWISELQDDEQYFSLSGEEMKERIQEAGICGMGGAGFPTHVKLSPPVNRPIDTVILNGVECEPYLTSDHRLMLEHPEEVIAGLRIIMKVLGAKRGYIGIELNKKDAIIIFKQMLRDQKNINVIPCQLRYPQGAEKQLIFAATKRKVPAGGLPMDVGVVVQNVGTAFAIYEALRYHKPLIERITTISGSIVNEPKNLKVPIGTPLSQLLEFCGGTSEDIGKIISGGPMMGFALPDLEAPATKTTSGFVFMSNKEVIDTTEAPCLRCGRCVDACPMNLLPTFIADKVKNGQYEEAMKLGVLDCIECGSCGFVCPSHIQLVQWIKIGKIEANKLKRQDK